MSYESFTAILVWSVGRDAELRNWLKQIDMQAALNIKKYLVS